MVSEDIVSNDRKYITVQSYLTNLLSDSQMMQMLDKILKIDKMQSSVDTLEFTGNVVGATCLTITVLPLVATAAVAVAPVVIPLGAVGGIAALGNIGAAATAVAPVSCGVGSLSCLLH